ncbi:MAG TPA: hypothetical protein VHX86_19420, partial [Tepidisphaeraceae bacterium]|nr:hypothetical protein [Tepidisphaeraceae bacterium]
MRRKAGFIWAGSMVGLAMPVKGLGAAIVEYNFGNSATAFTYAATTIAPNVTASGIDSTNDFGDADTFTVDAGQTSAYYANDPGGGVNILSVESSQSATDDNFWVETIVTANPGYAIDPTSFELYAGAGGSSAMRSAYIYDSADDALDPNITPTATGGPTGTDTMANPLQGSGTFTAVRSTSSDMNEIQVANFPSTDVNLTSFTVRVYFDTQGNVDKNIDLGYLELDGSVVALPVNLSWNNTDGTGDGVIWDIGNNQNWNNGSGPATYSDGSDVTFDDNNVNNYAVTLNDTVSPGSVTFGNNNLPYTLSGIGSIAGTGSLTMNGASTVFLSNTGINSYSGGTNVSAGTLVIGAAGALPANSAVSITGGILELAANTGGETLSSLSVSAGGFLDVGNNHFIISDPGGSIDSTIRGYLANGYNGGAWNGTSGAATGGGIGTSSATGTKYGIGYADGADGGISGITSGQLEVKYTLYGDANLDGAVNSIDFGDMAANFGKSGKVWDQGDFNYDGVVNSVDFGLLAGNFGKS